MLEISLVMVWEILQQKLMMLKQEYEINAEAIRKIDELKKQFEEYQTKLDEEIMK